MSRQTKIDLYNLLFFIVFAVSLTVASFICVPYALEWMCMDGSILPLLWRLILVPVCCGYLINIPLKIRDKL